jgi:pimeloyl-ACP methyl ester carboxylesterase
LTDGLHVESVGSGTSAIFVHGSFGWGAQTFPDQRALADEYRVMLVDRRGFGGSASAESNGWPTDMHDVAELLGDEGPAHLVGQSYGAVVVLLAAGLRPERVLSLVAIEPPAYEVARGDPDADAATAALKPVYEQAKELTAREFVAAWGRGRGIGPERLARWIDGDRDPAADEASRRETWPGEAPIAFDVLASARFPKVLARGAWKPEVVGREGAGREFAAVCRVLAERIGARVIVFDRSAHNPQLEEPEALNRLLREVWAS